VQPSVCWCFPTSRARPSCQKAHLGATQPIRISSDRGGLRSLGWLQHSNGGHGLSLIDADRYRGRSIRPSSAGWRRSEPVDVLAGSPAFDGQAVRRVYGANR
jgi:hypothetical protein